MYSQRPEYNYGWFSNSLVKSEITLEEFTENGKYCKSGLAYYNDDPKVMGSTCVDTVYIKQAKTPEKGSEEVILDKE